MCALCVRARMLLPPPCSCMCLAPVHVAICQRSAQIPCFLLRTCWFSFSLAPCLHVLRPRVAWQCLLLAGRKCLHALGNRRQACERMIQFRHAGQWRGRASEVRAARTRRAAPSQHPIADQAAPPYGGVCSANSERKLSKSSKDAYIAPR